MATKKKVIIEGARILFRDFSGERNKYNNDRTFCVVLEPELADALYSDGWPVKWLEPRNDEEERTPYLRVKVQFSKKGENSFGKSFPQIVLISDGVKKEIDEQNVNILDWVNIENVDLQIRPFNYDINGKTGIKPYLDSLWITIREDTLESKYKNVPYAKDLDSMTGVPSEQEELPFN